MTTQIGIQSLQRKRRRMPLPAAVLFVLSALCAAATYRITIDALALRNDAAAARAAAADNQRSLAERTDGVVMLQVDVRTSIATLKQLALRDDELGHQARNALAQIQAALR